MGSVVSDIIKTIIKADEKEVRAKERLEMLVKLAHKVVEPSISLMLGSTPSNGNYNRCKRS
jgi:hypothetical protein